MRDGGEGKALELNEELKWDAEECTEQQGAPFLAGKAGAVHCDNRNHGQHCEEESVEDHMSDGHLRKRNFAEEKPCAPEGSGRGAGDKTGGAMLRLGHLSNVAQAGVASDREDVKELSQLLWQ